MSARIVEDQRMIEKVSVPSATGTCEALLATPNTGHGLGVVLIQEWWGLVPHIESVAERMADQGFVALAPDLYHGASTSEPDEAMRLMMGMAMGTAARDIAGAVAYLADADNVDSPRIGSIGFCMGGSLALWAATLAPQLKAAVGYYPGMPWDHMQPYWPNYEGNSALIHCSEEDGTSAEPGIQEARQAIEDAGGAVTLYDYPGTHHAFFNDERPEVYDADATELSWGRTIQFLRQHLGHDVTD